MALQKQNINIPFSGLDQKNDPFKLQPGKFQLLQNTVPIKGGQSGILLQKRNGFGILTGLPSDNYGYVGTFNGDLLAVGDFLTAYSAPSQSYIEQAPITEMQLTTLPLLRSSSNQSQVDSAVASNGVICTVYRNDSPTVTFNYVIADEETGQNIIEPTVITSAAEGARVFILGNFFIILYSQSTNLKYIAVPIYNPGSPQVAATLVTNYAIGTTQLAFDGAIYNNQLYVAYNATDGGGAIRMTYLNSFLVRQTAATGTNVAAGRVADMMSVCIQEDSPTVWVSFWAAGPVEGYTLAVDPLLNSILVATRIIVTVTVLNITSTAQQGSVTVFYEVSNTYTYGGQTNYVACISSDKSGTLTGPFIVTRSVGLASKAFIYGGSSYFLTAYSSTYQPSYFLQKWDGLQTANVVAKLAYSNGGGYLTRGLPSVSINDTIIQIGYLIKDLIVSANKSQSPTSTTPVFTQTGVNLANFNFTTDGLNAAEIGGNLNLSGGLLWAYDGAYLVEEGFNVWPDNVVVTTSTTGGNLKDQTYYYQALYEWTDNQGNIHRSAPSIAVRQVTTGGNTSTNTVKVPTLRLTYKTLVKIIIYRWSTDNQTYYQVTSLTSPTLNSKTVDFITFVDTFADSTIVGNSIIYTTGGVVENIGAPATSVMTLFKSRLFVVDGEDRNLIWFSKQVIESTPVEMSDLFTLYVAPTIGAQGNTGPISALSSMDDKLIIFKRNAIYYEVGNGPDNTGANNDFSDPVFITSTIGSENQNSIVFIPNGLMFQSDKGIWLLGRDLNTTYIGAPVEDFTNEGRVLSALNIPGTNQVRFTLDSGVTLMYDYFFGVWGTFIGIPGISSTLYQGLHTFINSSGEVFQETPGAYIDGSNPTLIKLTTGWMNFGGLQDLERAYSFYLLGTYLSPHKLSVQIAYDYNSSPTQMSTIAPINYSAVYGDDPLYGSGNPYGGPSNIEQWRIFFRQQKCQAFQITLIESYDASFGVAAGAGFTLSGINLVYGVKSGYPRLKAGVQVG